MCTPRQSKLCRKKNCDICGKRRVDIDLLRQCWIKEKNIGIDPVTDISKGSHKVCWFKCRLCSHHTNVSPKTFTSNRGCNFCNGNNLGLCVDTSCSVCNNRRDPEMLKYWIYEKNIDIDPLTIRKNSHQRFWFRCKTCSHETFCITENFNLQNLSCQYCDGGTFLCTNVQCCICDKRRDPDLIKNWIYEKNGDVNPYTIPKYSIKKFYVHCKSCHHELLIHPASYTTRESCRYCSAGTIYLCNNYECSICLPNRFSSDTMCKYWKYEDNDIDPRDIRRGSDKRCVMTCNICNKDYHTTPHRISSGFWCGCRKNKTERMVLEWVRETYPQYEVVHQLILPNCPRRRFDITIQDLKLIIEVDGPQHTRQVEGWTPVDEVQKADIYKMCCASEEKYSMIRISQEDIWNDTVNWKNILSSYIKKYSSPSLLLVSWKDEYNNIYSSHLPSMDLLPIDISKYTY